MQPKANRWGAWIVGLNTTNGASLFSRTVADPALLQPSTTSLTGCSASTLLTYSLAVDSATNFVGLLRPGGLLQSLDPVTGLNVSQVGGGLLCATDV